MDVVPIRVKIGLKPEGGAKYPNFNVLECVDTDWAIYVDQHGSGWTYDCCGHCDEEAHSPRGQQFGMLLINKEFADQAVAAFPDDVEILTDADAGEFYESHCALKQPDEDIDLPTLDAIKRKKDLLGEDSLTAIQLKALDPEDDTRGIRTNPDKTWVGFKGKRGLVVS